MPYVKVSTSKSGAWTVQLATKNFGKSVILRHIGSAHTPAELKRLKAVARQELERPALGQTDLFTTRLDLDRVRVISHKPEYLERIIAHHYKLLGFDELGPALLFDLVLVRLYQPCSKLRSLRLLENQFGRSYGKDQAYRLTQTGGDLLTVTTILTQWAETHRTAVTKAQKAYDRRNR